MSAVEPLHHMLMDATDQRELAVGVRHIRVHWCGRKE
jgi:hypothetical protein